MSERKSKASEEMFTEQEIDVLFATDSGDGDESDSSGNGRTKSVMNKLASALRKLGIVVEVTKRPSAFLEHLCTAINTHLATKDKGNGNSDDVPDMDEGLNDLEELEEEPEEEDLEEEKKMGDKMTGGKSKAPENPPAMLMSAHPLVQKLLDREKKRLIHDRSSRIKKMYASGKINRAFASQLLKEAREVELSLSSDGSIVEPEFDRWLARIDSGVSGSFVRMRESGVPTEEEVPYEAELSLEGKQTEDVVAEMARMAGVDLSEKNGKR